MVNTSNTPFATAIGAVTSVNMIDGATIIVGVTPTAGQLTMFPEFSVNYSGPAYSAGPPKANYTALSGNPHLANNEDFET